MSKLTIDEFKANKSLMERELAELISNSIAKFRIRTGYSPNAIEISLRPIPEFGVENCEYIMNGIYTEVEL